MEWQAFDDFVEGIMARHEIPGIAVGVLHDGQVESAGYGVTNIDHPLGVTPETLFQIGSVTKTFTGTLIMRLVEMGRLDLETRVREILPDFALADETAAARLNIRHLLTHTGGFQGDVFIDSGRGDDALARYVGHLREAIQLAPLGAHFSYNNAGFAVAGRIVERGLGQPYAQALRELVLEPLGMQEAFLDAGDAMTYRFAAGHIVRDGETVVGRPWYLTPSVYPVGGLICHTQDLLRYAAFHLGEGTGADGQRLLSAESMALMKRPQVKVREHEYRALSWIAREVEGTRLIEHGGSTLGQASLLLLLPEQQLALAILTNHDRGNTAARVISRWLLRRYAGIDEGDPQPLGPEVGDAREVTGYFSRPFADLEVGLLAGRLVGQVVYKQGFPTQESPPDPAPPPFTLRFSAADQLVVLDGPVKGRPIDVVRGNDGQVRWLRLFNRLHRKEG